MSFAWDTSQPRFFIVHAVLRMEMYLREPIQRALQEMSVQNLSHDSEIQCDVLYLWISSSWTGIK